MKGVFCSAVLCFKEISEVVHWDRISYETGRKLNFAKLGNCVWICLHFTSSWDPAARRVFFGDKRRVIHYINIEITIKNMQKYSLMSQHIGRLLFRLHLSRSWLFKFLPPFECLMFMQMGNVMYMQNMFLLCTV